MGHREHLRDVFGDRIPRLSSIFFGGGTPTLLPAEHLGVIVKELTDRFGLAENAEITTEANPETVTPAYLARLRAAGFTRISVGMQSAVPRVLAVLDRRFPDAPRGERAAAANAIVGLEQEFEPVPGDTVHGFRCETADGRYTTRALTAGMLRLDRRRGSTWDPAPARR